MIYKLHDVNVSQESAVSQESTVSQESAKKGMEQKIMLHFYLAFAFNICIFVGDIILAILYYIDSMNSMLSVLYFAAFPSISSAMIIAEGLLYYRRFKKFEKECEV